VKKISRYILVLIAILASAVAVPKLYWLAFEKPISLPFIMYSSSENDFFMLRHESGQAKRMDRAGNELSRDEYEEKLPLFFARQLIVSGIMPDTIHGMAMDIHEINKSKSSFRIKPRDLAMPLPGLYPLFESESGRASLEMPRDFFRITDRMEFVNAGENSIDERKSQMYTTVLNNRQFNFPAKKIAGIPTTRKSCDEGYIVIDSKDLMYHVKMIKGKPYVKKFEVPEGLTFKHIACVDFSDKKYYCYMISEENEIWILTQDDYEFVKFPYDGLIPETDELRIYGNMFNYTIIARREGYLKAMALDADYNKVDEYTENWNIRSESKQGNIASFLFPVQISLSKGTSYFNNFYFEMTKGFNWLILHVILIIGQIFIIRRSSLKVKKNLIDLAIIAATGLFGFIGVNFFQNKFFD
jgi:hypothetical protein